MAQFTIYGHAQALAGRLDDFSDAIHRAATTAFALPEEKRFHRFVPLETGYFRVPLDRSGDYTIIEVHLFAGRSIEAKKELYRLLYAEFAALGIAADDLEITLIETPRHDWAIRGVPGDELALGYDVGV